MSLLPASVELLIEEFSRLPGIGPRTAERLTFFLLRSDYNPAQLGRALQGLRQNIGKCPVCCNLTESDELCAICSNPERSSEVIAVVEDALDVVAIEKTGRFQGVYHVLGGVISPLEGIGPDKLNLSSLITRVEKQSPKEIILATNPNIESETTALYIRRQLQDTDVKVTRLARGLPVGGDLEYADQVTLGRALDGRQTF